MGGNRFVVLHYGKSSSCEALTALTLRLKLLDIAIARCLSRQEACLDVGSQALDLGAVPSGHSCVLELVKAVRDSARGIFRRPALRSGFCVIGGETNAWSSCKLCLGCCAQARQMMVHFEKRNYQRSKVEGRRYHARAFKN